MSWANTVNLTGKAQPRLWLAAFISAAWCLAPCVHGQNERAAESNTDVMASLPSRIDVVVAAKELALMRATRQGRALEAFLGETSDWSRTAKAWDQFSSKLGWSRGQAIDALLGNRVVVAGTGSAGNASDIKFAVISTIKNETAQRLRDRLEPVPRSIAGNVPVFSVEGGAFQVAAAPAIGTKDQSRLVLSADQSMFDQALALTRERPQSGTLSGTREWARIRDLVNSDLFVLMRGAGGEQENFFALAASPTRTGWTSRFIATDAMVLAGLASTPGAAAFWPSEAVDQLEQEASLLIAGSPRQQAAVSATPTLMTRVLGMMDLPDPVRRAMEGNAIIALTLGKGLDAAAGSSLVVALPINDIPATANACDAWALRLAGVPPEKASELVTIHDGVRSSTFGPATPAVINTYFKSEGDVAWCYAAQSPENGVVTAGWMVLSIQLGTEGASAARVRRLSHLLTHDEGRDGRTLFRLVVQPQQLIRMLQGAEGVRVQTDGPSLESMRWLNRVESRISRESVGMVEGTVTLDLNLKLLDARDSSAPPSPAGPQSGNDEGQ